MTNERNEGGEMKYDTPKCVELLLELLHDKDIELPYIASVARVVDLGDGRMLRMEIEKDDES